MASNAELVLSIDFATMQINRHVSLLVLLFGTAGNLLNMWILSDRSLSNNSCSTYLWWSSASSVIFVWSALLSRVLQGYDINWPNQNLPLCKIRLFILTVCLAVATWILVGASIDRYLRSSAFRYQQFSSVQTARRFVLVTAAISTLIFVEIFYCYEASVPNVPVACYPQGLSCRLYNNWMVILFIDVIPSSFMAIFGSLTIRNIRARAIRPIQNPTDTNNTVQNHLKPRINDRNISHMLLIQVLFLLLLNLPVAIQRLYASLTANVFKSSFRTSIENLIYTLVVLLSSFGYSISFYLYTLTGSIFRAVLKRTIRRLLRRIHLLH